MGVDGTLADGSTVDAIIAGQGLSFDAQADDTVRGYLGYDASFAMTDSASFNLSTEVGLDTNEARTWQASAGFSWTF